MMSRKIWKLVKFGTVEGGQALHIMIAFKYILKAKGLETN